MSYTDLIPWGRNRSVAPSLVDDRDPFFALHRNMSRLLDDFSRGFAVPGAWGASGPSWTSPGWSGAWPHVELSETDTDVKVVAELPGLEQKDVDVSLHDGVLTIKGQTSAESKTALYSERWQGAFSRAIQVGHTVDPEKVTAAFKNGVLTITLAKRPEAQSRMKRIPVQAAA